MPQHRHACPSSSKPYPASLSSSFPFLFPLSPSVHNTCHPFNPSVFCPLCIFPHLPVPHYWLKKTIKGVFCPLMKKKKTVNITLTRIFQTVLNKTTLSSQLHYK
ncbi:hypothetical protein GOODEAATRI_025371 [Goodea atripinnis]|uniref:Uncharacterized protein n=1 Tax=Goodea atripinnis TaxID=208336 RepID=A0ABV0P7R4_9TELE